MECKDLDEDKQNLIIIDDYVVEKKQKQVEDLFIRCRKRNTSIIYQTQNLFETPKNIRINCNYVILFGTNKREQREIAKTYANDMDYDEFLRIYQEATSEPFGWLLIDATATSKCLRYRNKFDGLYVPRGCEV